jgi:hypothetical protein
MMQDCYRRDKIAVQSQRQAKGARQSTMGGLADNRGQKSA